MEPITHNVMSTNGVGASQSATDNSPPFPTKTNILVGTVASLSVACSMGLIFRNINIGNRAKIACSSCCLGLALAIIVAVVCNEDVYSHEMSIIGCASLGAGVGLLGASIGLLSDAA